MSRERGHVPSTPEEIAAAWADAERVVREEAPIRLRRYLRHRWDRDDMSVRRAILVALGIAPRPDMTPTGRLRRALKAIRPTTPEES